MVDLKTTYEFERTLMNCKDFSIYKIRLFCFMAAFLCCFSLLQVNASDQQHHQAHVHGIAQLNITLEDNELYIEFETPAANIVGFEHAPKTDKEEASVDRAIASLKSAEKLFIISKLAGATLIQANVETGMEGGVEHDHDDEHKHERHKKDHHDDEHHDEDHADHDEHENEEHGQHSDFKAVYRFSCQNPDRLMTMDVMLFHIFKGIEQINVQLLTSTKQSALQLTAKNSRITF